jgi:hypothetical protein
VAKYSLTRLGSILPTVVVLACTILLLFKATRTESLGHLLGDGDTHNATMYQSYVVLQPGDCTSNLEFLHLFSRPKIRSQVRIGAVVVGDGQAVKRAKEALARQGFDLPVQPLSNRIARALTPLGYSETPFLIVLDTARRVRVATTAPAGYDDLSRFEAILEQVVQPHSVTVEP